MDLKNELRLIAFVFVLFAACVADEEDSLDNSYIFLCPRTLKVGMNNQLQMFRFGETEQIEFILRLYYKEGYNGNETLAQTKKMFMEKGETMKKWNLYVNPFDHAIDSVNSGRVEIDGECIMGSDKVNYQTTTNNIMLLQTDKPIYKPGQDVQFRMLKVDKHLRPSGKANDTANVYVEDSKGTLLLEFLNVHLGQGIVQRGFPLSEEPVLGIWKIKAVTNQTTVQTQIEVKKYDLPKFDVQIIPPPFVLANAEYFCVEIVAKYTYGKPVVGTLNTTYELETYSYFRGSRDKTPTIQGTVENFEGNYTLCVNVTQIDTHHANAYRRIVISVSLTEEGTGVQRNATEYITRQYYPFNINFERENYYAQYFKPGLPFTGKLKVTNPDDTPAAGEPIQICTTITRERIIFDWLSKKKIKNCCNRTSDSEGNIQYILGPQSTDAVSVQLEATSLKYGRDSGSILNQPSAGMTLSPYYSPSGSFIQMETIGKPIPCGTQQIVRTRFTSTETYKDFELIYEILRQGKVVKSGRKMVKFDADDDDVSSNFDNEDELINCSEKQLVPDPQSISSSVNDSSDEDCQVAKDVKYVPFVGEVDISIDVDATMSPSFTLLVFYVRSDRETVADSQKIEVEKCFKNEVGFEFGDEVKQPGTKTSIKVTSSPNSLCGVKVVDKSVSLLNSNDQLTKEKIFQLINNMDVGHYYSSNPCNEKTPQPGLYSPSIIRPPGVYVSSSYADALTAFENADFLVISNLKLFTRPCYPGGGYGGGFQAESFSAPGVRSKKLKGRPVALASARRPAAPAAAGDMMSNKMGFADVDATKSAVEVRDYFPETWLFNMEATGPDGTYVSKESLPHTITEWVGSAVCINAEDGLGLSDTATIKGFQAFFISTTIPTTVIRGETFTIAVLLFSYVDQCLPITVKMDDTDSFTVISKSSDSDICIQPNTSFNLKIKLKAMVLGLKVNITIRAETSVSNDACGSCPVYEGLAKDALTQPIDCEPEGFPAEEVQSLLFCPTDEEDQTFKTTIKLSLPDDVVPDSQRAVIDATGNVMGPAIENLDSLVSLPTGCGEQNMVKFTPNYLVLDYLSDIGKLPEKIKTKAIRNLVTGYQRELTYRRNDGSFSAFGNTDREGSMFLTAYVLRCFHEAKRYIAIDDKVMTSAQAYIVSKQQENGCFANSGQMIDRGIQGGLENEKNSNGITAYVVAALIISKYENETVIQKALSCLSEDKDLGPYNNCLYAYTLATAGKCEEARKRLDDAEPYANRTEGLQYYKNPNGTKSLGIETTSYAVLANLICGESKSVVLPSVRYLTINLNPRGGFYSTQDTCVGLEALSKFASLVYKDPVDMGVNMNGILNKEIDINEDNKLLVQRNIVKDISGELQIEATGSGCALVQVTLRYNTKNPPTKQLFYLEVIGKCGQSGCEEGTITVITSYIPYGKSSGMSVIKVVMITGYVPVRESLDKLKSDENNILRCDVEANSVIIYVSKVTNDVTRVSFDVQRVVECENPEPGIAQIFDYYGKERCGSTRYSIGNPDSESPETDSESLETDSKSPETESEP